MEREHVCLDSTWFIDFMKNDPAAIKIIEKYESDVIYTTDITLFEVAVGIFMNKKGHGKTEFNLFLDMIENIQIAPPLGQFSLEAARTSVLLQKKGLTINDEDCFITAIMEKNNISKIITRNAKHFSKIPGIEVISY